VREPAAEKPAGGLDIGVGEHRQTRGYVRKSDCAPQSSQLIFVVSGDRRHVGDVMVRTTREHESIKREQRQPTFALRAIYVILRRARSKQQTSQIVPHEGIVSHARCERPQRPSLASAAMISPASESPARDAVEEVTPAFPFRVWATIRSGWDGIARGANRPRRIGIIAAVVAGLLVVAIVVLTLVEHHNYAGRVLPGVKVDGVPG